jgi:uncharacterized membrane protein
VIFAAIYIPQAAAWQNEVRARMHMPPTETANLVQVSLVAAIVSVLLLLLWKEDSCTTELEHLILYHIISTYYVSAMSRYRTTDLAPRVTGRVWAENGVVLG